MASRNRYGVIGLLLLLLLLAAGAYLYHTRQTPKPPPGMKVAGKQIEVFRSQAHPPVLDGSLAVNDRIITHDFGADIMYSDGTHIHLGPLTDIHIEQDPNGGQRLIITMGAMRCETTASTLGMAIGAPFGVIHIGAGEVTVLDISVSQGAFVRVGNISIERNHLFVQVPEGYQYTIDGLVLPIHPNDGITLQEIVLDLVKTPEAQHTTLKLAPLSLQLFPKPSTRYAQQTRELGTPLNPQALAQNDRVQTRGPGASILVEAWGRYLLDDNADLTVTRSGQLKRQHEAMVDFRLDAGGIAVLAPTRDRANFTTSIDVGPKSLTLSPGLIMAQAHVTKLDSGALIKLRFGRLLVGEMPVEAGSTVLVTGNDVLEQPLSVAHVDVTADVTTILHYPGQVPTVNFIWSTTPTHKAMNFEISQDTAFIDVPFAETITRGNFMVDQLVSNRTYYWRVGGVDAPVHQLQLESDTPDCKACIPPDVVSDAVPHTVIEYDETVAQVAFEWRPFVGAKYYLFRMYNDGQFEKPVVAHHANQPNYLLPSTHLEPGTYYWNAIAYDDEGRLLHKGVMSDFEIQEPDQVPPLSIEIPKDNAVVTAPRFNTEGQTRRHAKVWCNGVAIATDTNGHFSHSVPLHHGNNFLVYTVEVNKRMQHLYTRQVMRPAP